MKINKKTMVLLSGSGDTVVWFRLEFLDEFINKSYKVYVLAPDIRSDLRIELEKRNIELIYIRLERKGFNILNFFLSIIELIKIIPTNIMTPYL